MSQNEAAALRNVQGRLAERFPGLEPEVVEAAVRVAHAELTGPIRDFVPVLVEHIARDRLASMVDYPTPRTMPASSTLPTSPAGTTGAPSLAVPAG